jgi:hypothetical protein
VWIADTDAARVEFDQTKKEDVIIERFIHTEPQIKPLSADKLDNENKAKKSSEDQDDYGYRNTGPHIYRPDAIS